MYQERTSTVRRDRIEQITARTALMARRIEAIYALHGLSRRELAAVHRGIAQLHRAGAAPPPNEFWVTTALPRSNALTTVARETLDCELAGLAPLIDEAMDVESVLLAALPSGDHLHRLGIWWQRRLRRAAMVRAFPLIAMRTPGQVEYEISNIEMLLLDQPPWSHDDRLLSAFELAHADLVSYGRRRITELAG